MVNPLIQSLSVPAALIENGEWLDWNDAFLHFFNLTPHQKPSIHQILPEDSISRFLQIIQSQGKPYLHIFRIKKGQTVFQPCVFIFLPLDPSDANRILLIALPIPDENTSAFDSRIHDPFLFKKALDSVHEGVVIITLPDQRILYANEAFLKLVNCHPDELMNRSFQSFLTENAKEWFDERCQQQTIETMSSLFKSTQLVTSGNETIDVQIMFSPLILDNQPVLLGFVSSGIPSETALSSHDQLSMLDQTTRDPLTGLWNQNFLMEAIKQELNRFQRYAHPASLLFLDLDNFKEINEVFGYAMGNKFLREVGLFIAQHLRKADIIGRFGGDAFLILMPETGLDEAQQVARRILASLQQKTFRIDHNSFKALMSIGLVTTGSNIHDVDTFILCASMAMFWAKEKGGNRVVIFDTEASQVYHGRSLTEWRELIEKAIEQNALRGYYQLVFESHQLIPVGAEILLRLEGLTGELIPAHQFLPLAHRFGYSFVIDQWVIQNVPSWAEWLIQQQQLSFVSFNMSHLTLSQADFMDTLRRVLSPREIKNYQIHLEINGQFRFTGYVLNQLHQLSTLGLKITLDDFGARLIDPLLLKSLPIECIKIDGRLIHRMQSDPRDSAFVRTFHHLAHALNIKTIAEWVESKETVETLRQMGVDYLQGYYLHRPHPLPQTNPAT